MEMYALEVFVNRNNHITIKQPDIVSGDDLIISVHPEQIPILCDWLNKAVEQAAQAKE